MLNHYGFINDYVMTQSEIAQKLGLTQACISQIIRKNSINMRAQLEEFGIMGFNTSIRIL